MERWHGKTAVVTGAGAGIGAAVTIALADFGLTVYGLDIRPDLIGELQSRVHGEGSILSRQCDITKSEEVSTAFQWVTEHHGAVHILVNNAGVLHLGHITDVGSDTLSEDALMLTVDTIVKGTILCTRHAVASMKRNHFDGHIININSLAGHYVPLAPSMNVYAAAKHAISTFTESLLIEFAEFNSKIRVTSISPGVVKTNMAAYLDHLQLPSLRPEDVADAVVYALSAPPNVNISELTIMSAAEKKL